MARVTTTIAEKIELEQAKLNKLLDRRAKLDKQIKKSEQTIEKYRLIENDQRYTALEEAAKKTGVSVEDILSAFNAGDLLGLQERMEAAQKVQDKQEPESATA